ncbi:hypothetical protein BZD61_09235 [Listeria monocytogenes]|nr:hypothetical protein [Listeria monocytogenes]
MKTIANEYQEYINEHILEQAENDQFGIQQTIYKFDNDYGASVGKKYIYAQSHKIKIKCSVKYFPDDDVLLGTGEEYDWYKSEEGARNRKKADKLAIKLRTTDYRKYSYFQLVEVARLLNLDISDLEEQNGINIHG